MTVKKIDSMGDKFVVQDGIYFEYLNRLYIRSPAKIFVMFYLDYANENSRQFISKIYELLLTYNEVYPVLMLKNVCSLKDFRSLLDERNSEGTLGNLVLN